LARLAAKESDGARLTRKRKVRAKVKFFILLYLNIQIEFFTQVLIPAMRQKLFNHGQFGLTPPLNSLYSLSFGHKTLLDFPFFS
jgi:hypothetical protein